MCDTGYWLYKGSWWDAECLKRRIPCISSKVSTSFEICVGMECLPWIEIMHCLHIIFLAEKVVVSQEESLNIVDSLGMLLAEKEDFYACKKHIEA